MDPFTAIAVTVSVAGWISSLFRNEALENLRQAEAAYNASRRDLQEEYPRAISGLANLSNSRLAYATWLAPRLATALKSEMSAGLQASSGRRWIKKMGRLVKQASTRAVPDPVIFDSSVKMASRVAIVIEVAEWADHFQLINIREFHETIGEAISSVPIDGAGQVAGSLGDFGDLGVLDIIGDCLAVFSGLKLVYNISKQSEAAQATAELNQRTSHLDSLWLKLYSSRKEVEEAQKKMDEDTYVAFREIFLSEEVSKASAAGRLDPVLYGCESRLEEATSMLLGSLSKKLITA